MNGVSYYAYFTSKPTPDDIREALLQVEGWDWGIDPIDPDKAPSETDIDFGLSVTKFPGHVCSKCKHQEAGTEEWRLFLGHCV